MTVEKWDILNKIINNNSSNHSNTFREQYK